MITSWGKIADPVADKHATYCDSYIEFTGQNPNYIGVCCNSKDIVLGIESYLIPTRKFNHKLTGMESTTVILYFTIVTVLFNLPFGNIFIVISLISVMFHF